MNRRRFLISSAALLPATLRGSVARAQEPQAASAFSRERAIAGWRSRIEDFLGRGALPIVDTQATYHHSIDVEFIVREMDANGIAQVAFAPFAGDGSAASFALYEKYPQYFIPTTADGSSEHFYWYPDRFVSDVIAEIKTGRYFLMGEYELRHYPSPRQWRAGRMDRDVTVSLDSKAVHELFRFSEENKVAFLIHYEVEDVLLPPLEALLSRYPGAPVVWAHVGQVRYHNRTKRYGPDYVRALITRFPNLRFDLGSMVYPGQVYPGSGDRDMILYQFTGPPQGGYLKPEWKALFNEHPERFLAASDIDAGRFRQFPDIIQRMRRLIFSELTDRALHQIAYRNAWRLITGEAWGD
ncbi:MAG: amidohydrolase family protein [Betaproteobacteria bacterium]|nr:amidohydrolase family protein [Betaproteobacteria bacterium]